MANLKHIAMCCDENFKQHLFVFLISLISNNSNELFKFHFFIDDVSGNLEGEIILFLSSYNYKYQFYNINNEQINKLSLRKNQSKTAYYKYFIPYTITDDTDTVVYFDIDMIVIGDITYLFEVELNNKLVGMALDIYYTMNKKEKIIFSKYNLDDYFNSGVLIFNLKLFKKINILDKLINFSMNNNYTWSLHDQDGFNVLLKESIIYLEPEYNLQYHFFCFSKKKISKCYGKDYNKILDNTRIIHFTSNSKPWNPISIHPYKKLYFQYLELTPFKSFKPKITSLKEVINIIYMNIVGPRISHLIYRYILKFFIHN